MFALRDTFSEPSDHCYVSMAYVKDNRLHSKILIASCIPDTAKYDISATNLLCLSKDTLAHNSGFANLLIYYAPHDTRPDAEVKALMNTHPVLSYILANDKLYYRNDSVKKLMNNFKAVDSSKPYTPLFFSRFLLYNLVDADGKRAFEGDQDIIIAPFNNLI